MKGAALDPQLWGIRPETLAVIAQLARGELAAEDIAEHAAPQAARHSPLIAGGVAVLSLRGMVTPRPTFLSLLFGGGGGLQGFRASLREAVASDEIAAIVIDVDSPGGLIDLVPETAAEIRAARGSKPIVAVANTMAASAAYWLASQADELVVTPSGDVGSIGVLITHEEYSKLDERIGITTTLIHAGKHKTLGNPYEPLSDEARAMFQERVDDAYAMFVTDVAKGRGVTPAAVRQGFGEGRLVTAKRAVSQGMADRVDTFEGTVARLAGRRRGGRAAADAILGGTDLEAAVAALREQNELLEQQLAALQDGAPAGEAIADAPATGGEPETAAADTAADQDLLVRMRGELDRTTDLLKEE